MNEANKKMCFTMDKEMHANLKSICAHIHCSMKTYILKAIAEKMRKDIAGPVERPANKG